MKLEPMNHMPVACSASDQVNAEQLLRQMRASPCYVDAPAAPVSVVILSHNEQVNIVECLASCAWCDDVHVLDSGSSDHTVAWAQALGAQVHHHPFSSFGEQRNWAIDHIPVKHDWSFHLDADERFTAALVEEIDRRLAVSPAEAGFHVAQKLMLMGRWLRRASSYPTYQMRLFHRKRCRFCDYGHGQREWTDGTLSVLREPYLHFSFSKGLSEWLDKHNRYSTLEARNIVRGRRESWQWHELFGRDRVRRWRAWKELIQRLPLRAHLRWLATLFVAGGMLDGRAGFTYARLLFLYEQMITTKVAWLRHHEQATTLPIEDDANASPSAAPLDRTDDDTDPTDDPHQPSPRELMPEASPWTLREKIGRAIWMLVGRPVFRASFHNWYRFRALWLRLFGAQVGRNTAIRPSARIEVPWMLEIEDDVTVGDHVILYSLGRIHLSRGAIISQYTHLCAGTHDYTDRRFPLIRSSITIGPDVWIGADAFVGPGVRIGRLSVLGARASAYKDLPERSVCVGNPAKPIKERVLR